MSPGEAFGYALGVIVGVILVIALVGGAMILSMWLLGRGFILWESLRRRRASARMDRFLAEREALQAERPVRRIGEGA